jgi:hypothetical protein
MTPEQALAETQERQKRIAESLGLEPADVVAGDIAIGYDTVHIQLANGRTAVYDVDGMTPEQCDAVTAYLNYFPGGAS